MEPVECDLVARRAPRESGSSDLAVLPLESCQRTTFLVIQAAGSDGFSERASSSRGKVLQSLVGTAFSCWQPRWSDTPLATTPVGLRFEKVCLHEENVDPLGSEATFLGHLERTKFGNPRNHDMPE